MSQSQTQHIQDESHYEGLMSSMRHARNRLLFFILFAAYNLLAILGTTDKMLYMESPLKMPLLNIELPLLAFYTVMPLFLLVSYFHLLYTFQSYRRFLLNTKQNYPNALKIFPIGLYEGALLNQDGFHRIVRFFMRFLLYIFPVFVLTAFWFRFADYQSPVLTLWHFIAILIAMVFGLYFRGLLKLSEPLRSRVFFSLINLQTYRNARQSIQNLLISLQQVNSSRDIGYIIKTVLIAIYTSFKKWHSVINLMLICWVFFAAISIYHRYVISIIFPLFETNISLEKFRNLQKYERNIDKEWGWENILKRTEWFLPRITLRGETLIPIDKDKLEVLKEVKKDSKDQPSLFSIPAQNKINRNFRLAILKECILPNTNFHNAQFQGASLNFSQLQGAYFVDAQLQGASLSSAQLQGASLSSAQLQGADLRSAQLQGADLRSAQLQGADLRSAQLQGAYLRSAQLQGADLRSAQLQGAYLRYAQLQGADLRSAQLQSADLRSAQLQSADLRSAQLQGADLRSAQLQGAYLIYAQLQGADLRSAQLQGADLRYAQLQGVSTDSLNYKFNQKKRTKANIANINLDTLAQAKIDKIIKVIQPYIKESEMYQGRFEYTKQRLQNALGKDPIQWIKNQEGINLGILTEAEFNKIAAKVTDPDTRKWMGLPPLKSKESPQTKPQRTIHKHFPFDSFQNSLYINPHISV